MPTLGPAALEHVTAGLGAVPLAETMGTVSTDLLWLVGTLHDDTSYRPCCQKRRSLRGVKRNRRINRIGGPRVKIKPPTGEVDRLTAGASAADDRNVATLTIVEIMTHRRFKIHLRL